MDWPKIKYLKSFQIYGYIFFGGFHALLGSAKVHYCFDELKRRKRRSKLERDWRANCAQIFEIDPTKRKSTYDLDLLPTPNDFSLELRRRGLEERGGSSPATKRFLQKEGKNGGEQRYYSSFS